MRHDTDLHPEREAEELEAQREAELARRIRREVRRVQSGEADQEMAREAAEEEAQKAERQAREAQKARRSRNVWRGMLTGNILRQEWFTGHYRYPLLIAGVFLLSIIVMFWSLRLDMTISRTEREVQLLREQALRLREQRNRQTGHSAVVEALRQRNIPLSDPLVPSELIEE